MVYYQCHPDGAYKLKGATKSMQPSTRPYYLFLSLILTFFMSFCFAVSMAQALPGDSYTVDPIGIEDFWAYTEDSVNPVNGNLVLVEKDLSIPGRGIPVGISRTFNSRTSSGVGIFGYGWASNLEVRLLDAGDGTITLVDGDNTRHTFRQTVDGRSTQGNLPKIR